LQDPVEINGENLNIYIQMSHWYQILVVWGWLLHCKVEKLLIGRSWSNSGRTDQAGGETLLSAIYDFINAIWHKE
jgi:hypothetical protein